jgi:hypothetical protein
LILVVSIIYVSIGFIFIHPLDIQINRYSDYYKNLSVQCDDTRVLAEIGTARAVNGLNEMLSIYCCKKTVLVMAQENGFSNNFPPSDESINKKCPEEYSLESILSTVGPQCRRLIFNWCKPIN